MVNFKLENIGLIDNAEVSLNDFTLICGQNNTGKTYITYSIYGFLHNWSSLIDFDLNDSIFQELNENGFCKIDITNFEKKSKNILDRLSEKYTKSLDSIFSTDSEWFSKSSFQVEIENFKLNLGNELSNTFSSSKKDILQLKKVKDSTFLEISILSSNIKSELPQFILERSINESLGLIFFGEYLKKPFIITSERTGISLFHTELDINRNVMVEHLTNNKSKDINPFKLFEENISRYAMPIRKNIDFSRELEDEINRNKSFLFEDKEIAKYFTEMLNGGMYKFIKNEGIVFVTKKTKTKESKKIPMYLTSSASKSLLDLYAYITRFARKDEILIIDEPELNLHPNNHIIMARLLVYLLNNGIKVFITTHSDYLVKELNNLIRLNHKINEKAKTKIFKEYKYKEHDILDYKRISTYINDLGKINQVQINDMGMKIETFDTTINCLSNAMNEIYFNIED